MSWKYKVDKATDQIMRPHVAHCAAVTPTPLLLIRIRVLTGAVIRQFLPFPSLWATTNTLKPIRGSASHHLWRIPCVINNPCHLENMCLALPPFSNKFWCFTVNGLQVLCLTECGLLLPARGLDNCHWWVVGTNKVAAVWALRSSGVPNPKETVATAWLLEKWNSGKFTDLQLGKLHSEYMCLECLVTVCK